MKRFQIATKELILVNRVYLVEASSDEEAVKNLKEGEGIVELDSTEELDTKDFRVVEVHPV